VRIRNVTWATVRRRLANERRSRRLAATTARVLQPPPPSAYGSFGERSVLVPPTRVTRPDCIYIGSEVIIHEHAWIALVDAVEGFTPRLTIGDGTHIDRLCHIACVGEIEIGPECLLGERVLIGDTYHRYDDPDVPVIHQPMAPPRRVTIGRGVHIGMAAIIGHGVTVGENAYIGAGAVVTRDVPARAVVVGNPARIIRQYNPATGQWDAMKDSISLGSGAPVPEPG
jgi:abequosyltransferase